MGKDPAFLFYDGDAARDVSHMNRLERGCYFDLIQAQRKFNSFTIDQAQKILGKDFDKCWPSMELILQCENGLYFILWVKESLLKRKRHSDLQTQRVNERWKKYRGITTVIPDGYLKENEIENEKDVIINNISSIPGSVRGEVEGEGKKPAPVQKADAGIPLGNGKFLPWSFYQSVVNYCHGDREQAARIVYRAREADSPVKWITAGLKGDTDKGRYALNACTDEDTAPGKVRSWIDVNVYRITPQTVGSILREMSK